MEKTTGLHPLECRSTLSYRKVTRKCGDGDVKYMIQTWLSLAAALLMLVSCSAAAAESVHYRWMDSRGNPVHSDRPPPEGVAYEVISTNSSLVRKVDPTEGAVPATTEPSPGNEFEQVNAKPQPIKKNSEQCKRAQQNLETLNTKKNIQIRNDQGELRSLNEEEKEIQRQKAKDAIAVHCN
ncbi:DUF4124 domain-containing protein [Pseudomonadota bacterium]